MLACVALKKNRKNDMILGSWISISKKGRLEPYLTLDRKINLKWYEDLNIRSKIIKTGSSRRGAVVNKSDWEP